MINGRRHFSFHLIGGKTVLALFDHLSELKVFNALLMDSDPNFKWVHTKDTRKRICFSIATNERVEDGKIRVRYMSEISFKKHLSKLTKKRILIKESRGIYKINKNYIT